MKALLTALQGEFQAVDDHIATGNSPVALSGLSAIHRATAVASLWQSSQVTNLVLVADEEEGKDLCRDISAFLGTEVPLLPSRPFSFYPVETASHQWEHKRLELFYKLQKGDISVLVATIEGAMQRTLPPLALEQASFTLKIGDVVPMTQLSEKLVRGGYLRCDMVEGAGQFSIRGGIIDIFSPNSNHPVRLDFFGDDLDSMGYFDVDTQRRRDNLDCVTILPVAEVLPHLSPVPLEENAVADLHIGEIYPNFASLLDYLPVESQVILSQCSRIGERAKSWQWQMEEDSKVLLERGVKLTSYTLSYVQLHKDLQEFPVVYLESFTLSSYPTPPKALLNLTGKPLPPFGANIPAVLEDLAVYQKQNLPVVVLVTSPQRGATLFAQLEEEGIIATLDYKLEKMPQKSQIVIAQGGLSAGLEQGDLVVLSEGLGTPLKKSRPQKSATNRQQLKSYADLSVGDLVVHELHGIGRYRGMEKMKVDGIDKDYILIAYAGTDELYVPATQLDMVSKYIGGGEDGIATKKLSKLGGTSWEKSKKQAKKAVADLAKGLIQLYAQRQKQQGFAFSPDSPWQKEFEDQFPFPETDDQLRSVEEIKMDMEGSMPMDRLLCGDVGYGKTEVAFRAMMKCVMDGKQTAILVPTTVLARQHFLTAVKRFEKYPVTVDVVSRFRTPAQMKETLRKVGAGEIDILIGTHRLFQKDVIFKDLGLLVVDEEQRFGVSHKEKLKERFAQVDVLTLSATPIPRTLNMALSGIRDMSTLEEPPANRQPVQTYVMEENWGVLADAMRRELERGGQVFLLHNRIEGMERTARQLGEMLGDIARVAVAHGRMGQDEINNVMSDMTDGVVNVLICTTIIETGIDLPNANTLIIQDADKLGLAQLHQIRGRVGRSNRRAFAYLTYREGKILSEVATKRLSALREFAEFGSGFKIAMRDLEIRGAGNVLGPEQSGFMLSVGYDLYLKLLEEAVLTQQGKPIPRKTNCVADLTVAASVPDRYVAVEEQRMDLYRRIAALETEEQADDLVDELLDRYGEPPRTVNNLISVALLRAEAVGCGITHIAQKQGKLHLHFQEMDFKTISALCNLPQYLKRLVFVPSDEPQIALHLDPKKDVLVIARKLVADLKSVSGSGN